MKLIKLTAMLALALAMTVAATGCKRKVLNPTPLPGQRTGVGGTGPQFTDTGTKLQGDQDIGSQIKDHSIPQSDVRRENLNIIPGKFPNQTVYFALDSHQVRDSERMKVEAVAAAMTTEPNLYLIIEGHCDERGTEEYNRALGSQRALSLREELVKAGISGQRILTETYGEDRPAVQGHDEAAWSKNRRGEFVAGTLK